MIEFFDLLKELRHGTPSVNKAAKALKIIGWMCLAGGIWNFIFPFIIQHENNFLRIPEFYPFLALIIFFVSGILCLISASKIKNLQIGGIKIGQTAILITAVSLCVCLFVLFYFFGLPEEFSNMKNVLLFFFCAASFQFFIPAYFGIRYLGKLEKTFGVSENNFHCKNKNPETEKTHEANKYINALLPFGIHGNLAFLVICAIALIFMVDTYFEAPVKLALSFVFFISIFFIPIYYNSLKSPFEEGRNKINSFTGGGSVFMMSGSWPFFKLIIYDDGIEIRFILHRFFIPYESLSDTPEKAYFFSWGIVLKSDLPNVPSIIRFMSFRNQKVLSAISEARKKYSISR